MFDTSGIDAEALIHSIVSASTFLELKYHKYPKVVEMMANRHIMYNRQLEEIRKMEKENKVYVIAPYETLNIKRTENDPEKLEQVYQEGRKVAKEKLNEVKAFLS